MKRPTLLALRDQILKWALYNLLILPVIAAFYIPYNLFWLQFNSLQLLKWFLTAGAASGVVNIILRPWNVKANKIIERLVPPRKEYTVEGPNEEGTFLVSEVEDSKK